ncbi:unnamed protein product [Penicillium glandicola]
MSNTMDERVDRDTHDPPSHLPVHTDIASVHDSHEDQAHFQGHSANTTTPEIPARTLEEGRAHTQEQNANTTTLDIPGSMPRVPRDNDIQNGGFSNLGFYDQLLNIAFPDLLSHSQVENVTFYNISPSTLQRMVIHELQHQLIMDVKNIERTHEITKASMQDTQNLLTKYNTLANAIRDYDFMIDKFKTTAESGEENPFSITAKDGLNLYMMRDSGSIMTGFQSQGHYVTQRNPWRSTLSGVDPKTHHLKSKQSELWDRLWMGFCGGLALIAPMLLMVLHKDQVTTLATASIATMLFAVGLAYFGSNLKGQEVLASVAAYAAVLVVFVGTNS